MSRWTDSPARRRRGDGGFTLVEVIVALGVIMLVSMALLPQLVVGIQSTGVARDVTQTKGVAQGEIERMRNLPFHIAREAGQYVDVLDRYYPDGSTTPGGLTCTGTEGQDIPLPESATGFVPSSGARCGYEPTAGSAFFRTVSSRPATGDMGGYTVVVDAQFLSDATPPVPVAPAPGYDSQTIGRDNPPASQLGVTVTVFSDRQSAGRPVIANTQIASQPPANTRLRGRVAVRALEIGTVVLDPMTGEKLPLTLSAGLLSLAGSVSTMSKMTISRAAVSPTLASAGTPDGLSAVQNAPPDGLTPLLTPHAGALPLGCAYACWGGSTLNSVALSAGDGRPNAGSSGQPVRSELTDDVHDGLRFGNAPDVSGYVSALGLTGNLVQLDTSATRSPPTATTACEPSGSSFVSGAGFVTSTATDVVTCASASSRVVELFHTEQAPKGVVRLELVTATVSCRVQGATHTASASHDYRLFVQYWDNAAKEYQTVGPITKATQSDLLAAVDLSAVAVGGGMLLSDYISSWSSVIPERVEQTEVDGVAEVSIPGVASILTQPTRPDPSLAAGDTPSVVSLTVGALSCYAEDGR